MARLIRNRLMHRIDDHQHFFRSGLRAGGLHRDVLEIRSFPDTGDFPYRQSLGEDAVFPGRVEHLANFHLLSGGDVIDSRAAGAQAFQHAVHVVFLRFHARRETGIGYGSGPGWRTEKRRSPCPRCHPASLPPCPAGPPIAMPRSINTDLVPTPGVAPITRAPIIFEGSCA